MQLNLKSNHKPVQDYYQALRQMKQLSLLHEGAVAPQFANLLRNSMKTVATIIKRPYLSEIVAGTNIRLSAFHPLPGSFNSNNR
jgi:hypothetical protein